LPFASGAAALVVFLKPSAASTMGFRLDQLAGPGQLDRNLLWFWRSTAIQFGLARPIQRAGNYAKYAKVSLVPLSPPMASLSATARGFASATVSACFSGNVAW
jgi:hypothetical protein